MKSNYKLFSSYIVCRLQDRIEYTVSYRTNEFFEKLAVKN